MVYKNFRIHCIIRVVFLGAFIYLFFYLLLRTQLYATTTIVGLLSVYQIYALIRYVEQTNRNLTRFLQSIRYSDFSQAFTRSVQGSSFKALNEAFGEVMGEFRKARAEKEEHYRYLQTVVQHVGLGLMSYNQAGQVELINNAAKRLLKTPHLRNIDELACISPDLVEKLRKIQPGGHVQVKVQFEDGASLFSIYATEFIRSRQKYTLVSIQNIQSELEEKEMEAWQTLIRTLTHEIMNSITPISSLASTASTLLKERSDGKDSEKQDEILGDVQNAVWTIEKRSAGLINFVEDYRKLTRIPRPRIEIVPIRELFDRVNNLMGDQFSSKKIECKTVIDPESLELTADPDLIEQVLINLCKNAVEAVVDTDHPTVELVGKTDSQGRPLIHIIDNGPGIEPDVVEKIFIPFYTTKKEGSGIGLALSKQIMRMHRGSIIVASAPAEKTTFTLRF